MFIFVKIPSSINVKRLRTLPTAIGLDAAVVRARPAETRSETNAIGMHGVKLGRLGLAEARAHIGHQVAVPLVETRARVNATILVSEHRRARASIKGQLPHTTSQPTPSEAKGGVVLHIFERDRNGFVTPDLASLIALAIGRGNKDAARFIEAAKLII